MPKNVRKYLAMLIVMVCFGSATIAQKKPSEKKLSAEITRIKEMQSRRNVLVSRIRKFSPSEENKDAGNPIMIIKPGKPFSTNIKPSRQPMSVPPGRDIVVPNL